MQSDDVLISIIITCFNYEAFVGQAIASVLDQAEPRCELLVVDDGSLDGSWQVIRRYPVDRAIRVPQGGAARAALAALDHARAPFVLFLDADDMLAPGSLAQIIARLDPTVAKLQFPLVPVDEDGRVLGASLPRLRDERSRAILQRQVMATGVYVSPPTSGNVFRRDVCALLNEIDYEMSVDGVTLFAAPFFGDIVSMSAPLGFYRLHRRNYSGAGSRPTAQRFAHEADRFKLRHEHLGRILARRGVASLPDPRRLLFYRERRFYQQVLEGVRPTGREVLALQFLALRAPAGLLHRMLLALFIVSCYALPKRCWPAMLAWRFRPRRGLVPTRSKPSSRAGAAQPWWRRPFGQFASGGE